MTCCNNNRDTGLSWQKLGWMEIVSPKVDKSLLTNVCTHFCAEANYCKESCYHHFDMSNQ